MDPSFEHTHPAHLHWVPLYSEQNTKTFSDQRTEIYERYDFKLEKHLCTSFFSLYTAGFFVFCF